MPAKARNYTIAFAFVLHFQHHALIGFVGSREWLRDYAVKARTLKATKPICRHCNISGCRRHMDWWCRGGEQRVEGSTTFLKRPAPKISVALAKQIEEHNRRRYLLRKKFD